MVGISVIIPVFNCEKYLDICITSVLMQSYQDYEIICIDDKSTDDSLTILKKYAKNDNRIKILTNDVNKGPGYCRNKGVDVAEGRYIFFLDSDDWINEEEMFSESYYDRLEFLYKRFDELLHGDGAKYSDEREFIYNISW